jgi:hypothetical protein
LTGAFCLSQKESLDMGDLGVKKERLDTHEIPNPTSPLTKSDTVETPKVEASADATKFSTTVPGEHLFLGEPDKASKISRQIAITRCLNSISGGSRKPWKAYPGHSKLVTLDIDHNGTRKTHQYHSAQRRNSEVTTGSTGACSLPTIEAMLDSDLERQA